MWVGIIQSLENKKAEKKLNLLSAFLMLELGHSSHLGIPGSPAFRPGLESRPSALRLSGLHTTLLAFPRRQLADMGLLSLHYHVS